MSINRFKLPDIAHFRTKVGQSRLRNMKFMDSNLTSTENISERKDQVNKVDVYVVRLQIHAAFFERT